MPWWCHLFGTLAVPFTWRVNREDMEIGEWKEPVFSFWTRRGSFILNWQGWFGMSFFISLFLLPCLVIWIMKSESRKSNPCLYIPILSSPLILLPSMAPLISAILNHLSFLRMLLYTHYETPVFNPIAISRVWYKQAVSGIFFQKT